MSEQDWFTKDFYKELGVDKKADDAAIKKAYRKLARTYHPDHNPGDTAAEARFKDISEAYSVLSDKKQRQKYDAIRQMAGGGARFASGGGAGFEDLFGGMFSGGSRGGYSSGGAGFDPSDLGGLFGGLFGGGRPSQGSPFGGSQFSGFGAQGFDPSSFGAGSFGASRGHTSSQGAAPEKGADLKSSITLSFAQAFKGTEIRLTVNGKKISTRVPAGVKDGQKIKLPGKGKAGKHGGKAGDLVITVKVTPHEYFWREGNDVHVTIPVSLSEAVHGALIPVSTPDGSTVDVRVLPGSSSDALVRVAGRGLSTSRGTGDFVAHISIVIPSSLSPEAVQAVDAFTQAHPGFDPRASFAADTTKD